MEAIALDKKGFKLLRSNSKAIAHKTRMGFNLIEAAIVLAVVGGVIGGIWYSAAKFYEDYKVGKTEERIMQIVDGSRRFFPYQEYPETGFKHVEAALIDLNVMQDFDYKSCCYWPRSPENKSFVVSLTHRNLIPMIEVDIYYSLTIGECTKLVRKIVSRNKNNNTFYGVNILIHSPAWDYWVYPTTNMTTFSCHANVTQVIFVFNK